MTPTQKPLEELQRSLRPLTAFKGSLSRVGELKGRRGGGRGKGHAACIHPSSRGPKKALILAAVCISLLETALTGNQSTQIKR